ncbi:MAG: hypothetical protein ABIG44_02640 [Planctomycetota bacterium]
MEKLADYLNSDQAADAVRELGGQTGATEFAQVRNLDYVSRPFEVYPLAPRPSAPLERIAAITVDMDGTSTTTEPLALNSLEYMVRRFTGLLTPAEWPGLDPILDHPHVIGNSNLRHTEFLVHRYRDRLSRAAFTQAFFEAVLWTLANMRDPRRRGDVSQNARNCGLADLLADGDFSKLAGGEAVHADNVGRLVAPFVRRFGPAFRCDHQGSLTAAALDIYYMRYHSILREIEAGRGEQLSKELLGEPDRPLIEPMPGYDVFLPLIKGWLGTEVDALYDQLRAELTEHPKSKISTTELDAGRFRLRKLAEYFRRRPVKVALVTASITYETHASMKEVFRVMTKQVRDWPVPAACKDAIATQLADHRTVFDGLVCAADACEHRLKPHPDLYSLALFQMSIPVNDYPYCIGLEDTEPGIIALRAAGIGCAVALPNHDTSNQDYQAAARVITGGLPELMLIHNLLLADDRGDT